MGFLISTDFTCCRIHQIAPDKVAQALRVKNGALIQSIEPDGPAARAGLMATRRGMGGVIAGDVVTQVNGKQVKTASEFIIAIDECSVGDKVQVQVIRDGELLDFLVPLEES